MGEESNYTDSAVALSLDGEVPFEEAGSIRLTRLWKDAGGITQDSLGNDTIPEQEQVMVWNTVALQDYAIFSAEPLYFCLDAGEHTITLRSWSKEPLLIAGIELTFPEEVPTDKAAMNAYSAAGYAPVAGYYNKLQAESPALKSTQSIYPTYDRSSPATEPYDAYNIRRNTIGDGNWSDPGSWVSYHIEDVPADGLYYITLKYRQHQVLGSSTFRTIRINGAVPSEAYRNVAFPYNVNWQNMTISGEDGALVGALTTANCHAVCNKDMNLSADYPAILTQEAAKKYPGTVFLFLQGHGADINPLDTKEQGMVSYDELGRDLTKCVFAALDKMTEPQISQGIVASQIRDVFTPMTYPTPETVVDTERHWLKFLKENEAITPQTDRTRVLSRVAMITIAWNRRVLYRLEKENGFVIDFDIIDKIIENVITVALRRFK